MDIKAQCNLSLHDKYELTRQRLLYVLHEFALDRILTAWSGGKDSTLLLALFREISQQEGFCASAPRALSLDTGCKFQEVIRFRDQMAQKWGIDLLVASPDQDLSRYPLALDPVQCCLDLKIKPLQEAIQYYRARVLLTGTRYDEAPGRRDKFWLEEKKGYVQVNPILHWSEMDIWAWHQLAGLEYCPLYEQGYRSLGCQPCTRLVESNAERGGRNQDKESQLQILSSLGYF